ncbi:MAG: hypothetical protein Cons2KO_03730 [Congregibacter sp.]
MMRDARQVKHRIEAVAAKQICIRIGEIRGHRLDAKPEQTVGEGLAMHKTDDLMAGDAKATRQFRADKPTRPRHQTAHTLISQLQSDARWCALA